MSININQIELKNWFNYKGEYSDNVIKFKNGLNVFVGDNNAGKTKLHNAFRWVLKDEVIINENNQAIETKIEDKYLYKVLNHTSARHCRLNDSLSFGVRISFTKTWRNGESRIYRLTKEYKCRKDSDHKFVFINELKLVHRIEKITNQPRSIDESYEDLCKQIIPPNFINYFLVEGEQLGNLTPLEGEDLQTTINSIVSLGTLDHSVQKSGSLFKVAEKTYNDIVLKDKNISDDKKIIINEISNNQKTIEKLELVLINEEKKKEKEKVIINTYKTTALKSDKRKKILKQWDDLHSNLLLNEERRDVFKQQFVSQLTDEFVFSITKVYDDKIPLENASNYHKNIKTFISQRRTELNTSLTKDEQEMIMSLERSQPNPEILEQMVTKHHCFVCNTPLSTNSESYINEKLIPFFKNESDEDELLSKLINVDDLFKNLDRTLIRYSKKDNAFFKIHYQRITEMTENIVVSQRELEDFENEFGKPKENETDEVALITYTNAVSNLTLVEGKIDLIKNEINSLKKKNNDFNIKIEANESSQEVNKANELKSFSEDLDSFLKRLKKNSYKAFAKELQERATNRYRRLMKHTLTSDHKVKVNVIEDHWGNFHFDIHIINSLEESQDQAGGADQALRRVSVIFALVEMSENKNGYPFIADAPISRLSSDNKKEFFYSLLDESTNEDSAIKQSIIMSMDLISAEQSKKQNKIVLNNIGKELLEQIEKDNNSTFITVWKNKINYLKN